MQCPKCKKQFFGIAVCPECGGPLFTQEQMYKLSWGERHRKLQAARLAPEIRDSVIRLVFVFVFSCIILLAAIFIANSIAERKLSVAKHKKMIKSENDWDSMTPKERREAARLRVKAVIHKIDDELSQI